MDGIAMEFARENFEAADLGDKRLNKRLNDSNCTVIGTRVAPRF